MCRRPLVLPDCGNTTKKICQYIKEIGFTSLLSIITLVVINFLYSISMKLATVHLKIFVKLYHFISNRMALEFLIITISGLFRYCLQFFVNPDILSHTGIKKIFETGLCWQQFFLFELYPNWK